MIFGVLHPEKIWHQQLVHLLTSPVYCSHFTLGNPKKSFLTVLFIHASDYLRCLRSKHENDFFGFPKVKWLQYTGEVGKCTSCWCQIFFFLWDTVLLPKLLSFATIVCHSWNASMLPIVSGMCRLRLHEVVAFSLVIVLLHLACGHLTPVIEVCT